MANSIVVRALSADNSIHIKELRHLVTKCDLDSYTRSRLKDASFWKAHIGRNITSLGCFAGSELLAHIAWDRKNLDFSGRRLLFCMVAPDLDEAIKYDIFQAMHDAFSLIADKQHWSNLIYSELSSCRERNFFLSLFLCQGTLLSPSLEISRLGNQTLIHSQRRTFARAKVPNKVFFAPAWHKEICLALYNLIGVKNVDLQQCQHRNDVLTYKPADLRAIRKISHKRFGIQHLVVQPSLITSEQLIESSKKTNLNVQFWLDLEDSLCPQLCLELEERGSRFLGISSGLYGKECIAYSALNFNEFPNTDGFGVQARALAEYIESYNHHLGSNSTLAKSLSNISYGNLQAKAASI